MALLCFVLDLRSVSPPLLGDLKQSLLQLGNLYVASCGRGERERSMNGIRPLRDRIGLCYIRRSKAPSSSSELNIAYRPGESFNLRDFHHAVNSLPMDCFLPELIDSISTASEDQELPLASLLSGNALYSWGGDSVSKKVIVVGSNMFKNNEVLHKSLMDAADRCVAAEFVLLEHEEANPSHIDFEKREEFGSSINDLENCVLRKYLPDARILGGLVKKWLQELKNDVDQPLQAIFSFKNSLVGSRNQIICNLYASSNQIIDGFQPCKTCRCHGYPLDSIASNKTKRSCCPLTGNELGTSDLVENAVRVGEQTTLFLPSFDGCTKLQRISAPIIFDVIERTNLASLSEGVIIGASCIVTPAACHETEAVLDECAESDLNIQSFHALCGALFHLDQGLICSSTCNMETMTVGTLHSYYILQPSDKGPMLLRRLAGSEEILPFPEFSQSKDLVIPEEIEKSIQVSLSKIDQRDYNPLQHDRGLHLGLNKLVKESLQFGAIPSLQVETSPKAKHPSHIKEPLLHWSLTSQASDPEMHSNQNKEDNASSSLTEEWEELLVIDEMNDSCSPSSLFKPKVQNCTLPVQTKPLDEKTSRILERLEAPKQHKSEANSSLILRNLINGPIKRPLLPSQSKASSPLKPNFQRPKRKQGKI
ncbi:hypothetical protein J5N97_021452 [Dioscorea zingiberensis]|uniref:Uncharacterized protein n=1 Tax=Dioscorea zingiberensis TaxID=325984 RepID=A0A9D5CJ62_9LILI|nr:hypothetical protein J5N97_021452 [Dioscorea zingiberensis]